MVKLGPLTITFIPLPGCDSVIRWRILPETIGANATTHKHHSPGPTSTSDSQVSARFLAGIGILLAGVRLPVGMGFGEWYGRVYLRGNADTRALLSPVRVYVIPLVVFVSPKNVGRYVFRV